MTCEARQYSDEMNCARCGLVWDTNDPDPPPCPKNAEEDMYKQRPSRAKTNSQRPRRK